MSRGLDQIRESPIAHEGIVGGVSRVEGPLELLESLGVTLVGDGAAAANELRERQHRPGSHRHQHRLRLDGERLGQIEVPAFGGDGRLRQPGGGRPPWLSRFARQAVGFLGRRHRHKFPGQVRRAASSSAAATCSSGIRAAAARCRTCRSGWLVSTPARAACAACRRAGLAAW
jgi:hypothetical protein